MLTLWLAGRDPRVAWSVKIFCMAIAAYALSPIDLIPDFIPVLGYVDDAILLPLAILLVVRLLPAGLLADLRVDAERLAERPVSRAAAAAIVTLWMICAGLLLWLLWPALEAS